MAQNRLAQGLAKFAPWPSLVLQYTKYEESYHKTHRRSNTQHSTTNSLERNRHANYTANKSHDIKYHGAQTINLGDVVAKTPRREQVSKKTKFVVLAFHAASEATTSIRRLDVGLKRITNQNLSELRVYKCETAEVTQTIPQQGHRAIFDYICLFVCFLCFGYNTRLKRAARSMH